jgi:hypothetical protein
MTSEDLHRLLCAPEIVVVDLVDSALRALRLALLAEHPFADDPLATPDDPPIRRRARAILTIAARLRRALQDYRREVDHVLRDLRNDDIPF